MTDRPPERDDVPADQPTEPMHPDTEPLQASPAPEPEVSPAPEPGPAPQVETPPAWEPPSGWEVPPEQEAPPPDEPSPAAQASPGSVAGRRPNPLVAIEPEELPGLAAALLVVAVIALAFGALLVSSSVEGFEDEWKVTVKVIGLSTAGGFGFGFGLGGGALLAGIALLGAQWLVPHDGPRRPGRTAFVGLGTLAVAAWLALFTVLGIVVDFTAFGDDFVPAFGVLVSDLGSLAVLLLALWWGYHTFRSSRPVP